MSDACPPTCTLCRQPLRSLFEARDYRRPQCTQTYRVMWCDSCGLGRVAADLTPNEVAAFYQVDYYTHKDGDEAASHGSLLDRLRTHAAWRMDRGEDFAPAEFGAPGRVVDIGCGSGANMARLKAAGLEVVGIEPDPAARQVAAQHGEVHAGTAEAPPASAGQGFDHALMSHVLEHTLSPASALARARELLREGGTLIVEVPNCQASGFWQFGPSWPWTDVPRHLHFFTRGSLVRMLADAGFEVTETRYTGFTRQFQRDWIAELNRIHDELQCAQDHSNAFERQSWGLLLRSAWAPSDRKYDSVRVRATKRPG
jgi:SAM-dependent methyltransferase